MARPNRIVKAACAVGLLAVFGFLFLRSIHDARSKPYTAPRRLLGHWTVAFEPASSPADPVLVLRPPEELVGDVFQQVFRRAMESLSAPAGAAIPLVLKSEFDSAFAGHVAADALATAVQDAGLDEAVLEPRCLGYRRMSSPDVTRQLYFALFDAPAFGRFRQRLGALAGGSAGFDPAALSPVLFIAGTEPDFGRWMPFRGDPKADCIAPITAE
jgi:hypothetical protein